ncbi:hypothetical protein [Nocardia huaxiensis]|uniref:Uncharacterized protein n=1 Tax=Nocardia huaxiensis TaxID=2755382 RepID=A0A7D6ZY18_9NOCA|nr:hypothetical protein [Nocardia huaxiensis]QLY31349.1 hypothetical protein H0264_03010 [Nocardia huaxiensis]UFS94892.1 hypothetical protein LPY97_29845 [Nocardia huaxiensis]
MSVRTAATLLLATAALALSDPALAAADPTVEVVPGRARIKVTVAGTEYPADRCLVDPDADGNTQSIPMNASGTLVVENVAPGSRRVLVWCPQGGTIFQGNVDVQQPNPALDMQDRAFAAGGSSDRVSDPALR